jgi:predicted DNA-binding transcriptional regulator AlpA
MTISQETGREMLTAVQVHDMTGVPISTLHDWAAKRERGIDAPGPGHLRLSNRHRRWTRRDVEQWIESARIWREHLESTPAGWGQLVDGPAGNPQASRARSKLSVVLATLRS